MKNNKHGGGELFSIKMLLNLRNQQLEIIIYMYTHIHTYTYIPTYIHTYMHTHAYTYIYSELHIKLMVLQTKNL